MYSLIKRITLLLTLLILTFPAFANNLYNAKQQGLVGEIPNGYLGMVINNADTQALVKQVNDKRKQVYILFARKNKVTLQQIAIMAGAKAVEKTAAGHYVKNAKGKWVKK